MLQNVEYDQKKNVLFSNYLDFQCLIAICVSETKISCNFFSNIEQLDNGQGLSDGLSIYILLEQTCIIEK